MVVLLLHHCVIQVSNFEKIDVIGHAIHFHLEHDMLCHHGNVILGAINVVQWLWSGQFFHLELMFFDKLFVYVMTCSPQIDYCIRAYVASLFHGDKDQKVG